VSGTTGALGVRWRASAVLPYEDPRSAVAGLRAELRHLVASGEQPGTPDWRTFAVSGPERSTDARGRVWYAYTATLQGAEARSPA
jgi:hypothetical protein